MGLNVSLWLVLSAFDSLCTDCVCAGADAGIGVGAVVCNAVENATDAGDWHFHLADSNTIH